jgi:hypothetical protein
MRELLGYAMGKTTLGLEIRLEGEITPPVEEAIEALSSEQRTKVFLEALVGWSDVVGRLAQKIEEMEALSDDRDTD